MSVWGGRIPQGGVAMKLSAMVSVIPIGGGLSLSKYVAACERVFREAGLSSTLHAHGTNVIGEWGQVMDAVRRAVETVHGMGCPRVSTFLKLSTRTDREVSLTAPVESVEKKLGEADA
jgi:uncharacterized protein (TIGR00106 family)